MSALSDYFDPDDPRRKTGITVTSRAARMKDPFQPPPGVPPGPFPVQPATGPMPSYPDPGTFAQFAGLPQAGQAPSPQATPGQVTPDPTLPGYTWKDYLPLLVSAIGAGLAAPTVYGPPPSAGIGTALQAGGQGILAMREADRQRQVEIAMRARNAKAYRALAANESYPIEQRRYFEQQAAALEGGLPPEIAAKSIPKPVDPLKAQVAQATIAQKGAAEKASEAQTKYTDIRRGRVEQGLPAVPKDAKPEDAEARDLKHRGLMGKALDAYQRAFDSWRLNPGNGQKTDADFLASPEGKEAVQRQMIRLTPEDQQKFIQSLRQNVSGGGPPQGGVLPQSNPSPGVGDATIDTPSGNVNDPAYQQRVLAFVPTSVVDSIRRGESQNALDVIRQIQAAGASEQEATDAIVVLRKRFSRQ